MSELKPKLRAIEALPMQMDGQQSICLRDPLGFTDKVLWLSPPAFFIVSLFDGQHTLRDVQAEYMRAFGTLVYTEQLNQLVEQLDAAGFLDSPRFEAMRRAAQESFQKCEARPPAHAGLSYPGEAEALRGELAAYFLQPEAVGALPSTDAEPERPLRAAIAPHIDFRRGGYCYTWAYKEVAERSDADLFIVFGTGHAPMSSRFALTRKDYMTPLGRVETDRALVEKIASACPFDPFADEFNHRQEHSIEFQAVWLQYVLGGKRKFSIVPVLCGSFHDMVVARRSPRETSEVGGMIEAVREAVAGSGRKVCFLAGADLAHVGPRFGDPFKCDRIVLRTLAAADLEMLEPVQRFNSDDFFRYIAGEQDRRRICGFPPIYTMLAVMEAFGPAEGTLLKYAQRVDDGSTVTFASVTFY